MTTSEENNLIGYDPLAWMDDDTNQNEDHLVADEIDSENIQAEVRCDNQISLNVDYSDDLIGNVEESAISNVTKEDELVIVGIVDENDAILVEEMVIDSASVLDDTEEGTCDLDATLTIQNVVKLHEKLKNLLALHDEIEINASDVSSIDTATLQLLVSLKKDVVKLQKKVTIIYPSPRFVESTQLLGLLDVLDVHDA